MYINIKKDKSVFKPIDITISIETEEELQALKELIGERKLIPVPRYVSMSSAERLHDRNKSVQRMETITEPIRILLNSMDL